MTKTAQPRVAMVANVGTAFGSSIAAIARPLAP